MQTFLAPPRRFTTCFVRRLFDVVTALLVLILAWPVLFFIASAIMLDSRGPILFRQQRVGRDGRLFTIYKFRSMHVGAHDPDNPASFETRVGDVLRRWSLDELPQVFNILTGDMAVIGPHPILPAEALGYSAWQCQRLLIRPGLTGWAQVNGRNAFSRTAGLESEGLLDTAHLAVLMQACFHFIEYIRERLSGKPIGQLTKTIKRLLGML